MNRVLVTGGNGWIGRHAIKILIEKGYEVHAIATRESTVANAACKWHKVNLLNKSECENIIEIIRPSHLLHFAWETKPGHYWESLNNFLWVQSSLELLLSFVRHGGKRIVMAGTCAEYDWKYSYLCEKETPLSYDTPYATCKNVMQYLLRSYSETLGLSSAWGRIFFLYGPNEHPQRLVSSVILSLLQNKDAICTHGKQYRDFLHVYDAADAFVTLLENDIQGPVNIASGELIQLKDLLFKIGNHLGKPDLIRLGVKDIPEKEQLFMKANIGRLRKELKWQHKYSLDEGLKQTILWWKKKLREERNESETE